MQACISCHHWRQRFLSGKIQSSPFKHWLHREYNGFNPCELRVAEALVSLKLTWCRNPVGKDGYRIPIQELGSDTVWCYPDFLLWTENDVWARDRKGKHLVVAAVAEKFMDLSGAKGPQRSPKTGQWLSPENRPTRVASGTLTPAEACSLGGTWPMS